MSDLSARARGLLALLVVLSHAPVSSIAGRQPSRARTTSQTYTVNVADDFGPGTLRQAILDANANPGLDTIVFAIGNGPRTIKPSVPLPNATDPVVLDATTQPGFQGTPLVELDGSAAGPGNGLTLSGGSSVVRGFAIGGFEALGISIDGGDANVVAGNYVGTTRQGDEAHPNGAGVGIAGSSHNTIGGAGADRNVISGNTGYGLLVGDRGQSGYVDDIRVVGNYIGTNAQGTAALPNGDDGIYASFATGVTIGGTTMADRNVVSGNLGNGVYIESTFVPNDRDTACDVWGNFIGTNAAGTVALGNHRDGIRMRQFGRVAVGGLEDGQANVIAYNGGFGVSSESATGMTVLSNPIYGNTGGAIEYRSASITPAPFINYVGQEGDAIRVRGSIRYGGRRYAVPTRIQLFVNNTCSADFGEGRQLLGQLELTTNDKGTGTFDVAFPGNLTPSTSLSATTTETLLHATSRFAPCQGDTHGCEKPFVTDGSGPVDVRSGERATLTLELTGSEPYAIQWSENSSGQYKPIPGATSASYTTPPVTARTGYIADVSNACGDTDFFEGVSVCTAAPEIQDQPVDQYAPEGIRVILSLGVDVLSYQKYQWYLGQRGDTTQPIAGATNFGYGALVTSAPQTYWCRITNGCGTTDSQSARAIPGPVVTKISYTTDANGKPQLVIKGSGFAPAVYVTVDGVAFDKAASVKNGKKITQRGRLSNGQSLSQAIPAGQEVQIVVGNASEYGGYGIAIPFTR